MAYDEVDHMEDIDEFCSSHDVDRSPVDEKPVDKDPVDEKPVDKDPVDGEWRLTPARVLFSPPKLDDGDCTPSMRVSARMMGHLAAGSHIDEMDMISFSRILAEQVLGTDANPLDGFGLLMSSLHADFAYHDADRHLEGFQEGMLYGMTRFARMIADFLNDRDDSAMPASVLLHPDVLLASSEGHMVSVEHIARELRIPADDVRVAAAELLSERIMVSNIMGSRRFLFPTRAGRHWVEALMRMIDVAGAGHEADAFTGEGEELPFDGTVDRMMSLADFPDRDAARRAVALVTDMRGGDA